MKMIAPVGPNKTCAVESCPDLIYAKGWCKVHYQRAHKYGDPLFEPVRGRPPKDDLNLDRLGKLEDWVYIQSTMTFINKVTQQDFTLPAMRAAFGYAAGRLPIDGSIESFYTACFLPPNVEVPKDSFNTWSIPNTLKIDQSKRDGFEMSISARVLLDTLGGKHVDYLERWLAHGIQRPGHLSCALILHGVPGSGKSTLAMLLRELYGSLTATVNMNAIQGDFNPWLDRKLLIVAEEITASGFRDRERVANMMKTWTVGGEVQINRKGIPQYSIQNLSRWLLFSNDRHPMPIDSDDRRYSVIKQDQKLDPELGQFISDNRKEIAQNLKEYLAFKVVLGEEWTPMRPLENDDRKLVQQVHGAQVVSLR